MNTKNATPATKPEGTLTQADFIAEARIYVSVKEYEAGLREGMFGPAGPVLSAFDSMVAHSNTADATCLAASREALALRAERDSLIAKAAALDALVEGLAVAEAGIAEHIARAQADGVSANFGVLGAHRQLLLNAAKAAQSGGGK